MLAGVVEDPEHAVAHSEPLSEVATGVAGPLGATRAHVRRQFLGESVLLAGLGGIGGAALGRLVRAGFAASRGWHVALPA